MDDASITPQRRRSQSRGWPAMVQPLALGVSLLALQGCSSSAPDRKAGGVLAPSDFADPNAPPPSYQTARTQEPDPAPSAPALVLSTEGGRTLDLVTSPGSPAPADTRAHAAGGADFVDAKIGDINGRPIYVNEFLDPLSDRMLAEAQKQSRASWRGWARAQIRRELDGLVRDELLRAEAVSSLTPEQQQGLRSFLRAFREDVVSRSLGSQTLAAQRVEEETGQTFEQTLRRQEELTLVRLEFQRVINKRVNVSWRDVELRYEQQADKFNPDPTARFRLIRVRTSDAEDVARVTQALASGASFEEVASGEPNGFNPETGGLFEAIYDGDFTQGEFWAIDTLNERARGLGVGQVTGPFEFGSFTGWMKLDEIVQERVDLYDAQLQIYQELLQERRDQELSRYIQRLMERANVSGVEEIGGRLLEIAERRYGPKA